MFKRSEPETPRVETATPAATTEREPQQPRVHATIGSTIHIKGDVTGEENLTIDGTVDGTVTVKQHSLHVGKNGRLNADVFAKVIRIEGHVEGNLHAEEQVLLRASGVVRGNIVSPRLTMEDGCSFKGSVDMDSSRSARATKPADTAREGANGAANGSARANGAEGAPQRDAARSAGSASNGMG